MNVLSYEGKAQEMSLRDEVGEFFQEQGGPLLDIFVDKLSREEVELTYAWVRSISTICGDPVLWSIKEDREIPITTFENPAKDLNTGDVEMFHHCFDIEVNGAAVPTLGVFVEDGALVFDYRPGNDWGEKQVEALFEFLALIKDRCPCARIYAGYRDVPSAQFVGAFERYYAERPRSLPE